MLNVKCPECGQSVKVAPAMAGKRGRCPRCKAVFRIDAADHTPDAELASPISTLGASQSAAPPTSPIASHATSQRAAQPIDASSAEGREFGNEADPSDSGGPILGFREEAPLPRRQAQPTYAQPPSPAALVDDDDDGLSLAPREDLTPVAPRAVKPRSAPPASAIHRPRAEQEYIPPIQARGERVDAFLEAANMMKYGGNKKKLKAPRSATAEGARRSWMARNWPILAIVAGAILLLILILVGIHMASARLGSSGT